MVDCGAEGEAGMKRIECEARHLRATVERLRKVEVRRDGVDVHPRTEDARSRG